MIPKKIPIINVLPMDGDGKLSIRNFSRADEIWKSSNLVY